MVIKNKYYLCVVKIIHLILKTMLQLNTGDYFKVTSVAGNVYLAIKDKSPDATGCQICICIYDVVDGDVREIYIGGLVTDDDETKSIEMASASEIVIINEALASTGLELYSETKEIKPIKPIKQQ